MRLLPRATLTSVLTGARARPPGWGFVNVKQRFRVPRPSAVFAPWAPPVATASQVRGGVTLARRERVLDVTAQVQRASLFAAERVDARAMVHIEGRARGAACRGARPQAGVSTRAQSRVESRDQRTRRARRGRARAVRALAARRVRSLAASDHSTRNTIPAPRRRSTRRMPIVLAGVRMPPGASSFAPSSARQSAASESIFAVSP